MDVLSASSLLFWFSGCILFLANFGIEGGTKLQNLPGLIMLTIFYLALSFVLILPAVFIYAGLLNFPIWIILKYLDLQNQWTALMSGGLTGIITSILFLKSSRSFWGEGYWNSPDASIVAILFIMLGCVSGWGGYRIAYNGRVSRLKLRQKK